MSANTMQIKKLLIGLAEYFEKALTPGQLSMYSEDLEEFTLEEIGLAIQAVRRNPAQKFFPLPASLREEIVGNARDEALEASNRILEGMTRFGYTNPERAKQFIGELGWRVVEREGGWQYLCQRVQGDDLPILKAQWRELAAATIRRGNAGIDSAPALPKFERKAEFTAISALIPAISKGGAL